MANVAFGGSYANDAARLHEGDQLVSPNAYAAVGALTLEVGQLLRISEQSYHPFRSKVTTDFGAKLPPVSV